MRGRQEREGEGDVFADVGGEGEGALGALARGLNVNAVDAVGDAGEGRLHAALEEVLVLCRLLHVEQQHEEQQQVTRQVDDPLRTTDEVGGGGGGVQGE